MNSKIQRVLELARVHLRMDVSFLSEFVTVGQGSAEPGLAGALAGQGADLYEAFRRLIGGDALLPSADARDEPDVRGKGANGFCRIGRYTGIPLWLSNGSLYGVFCWCSHPAHALDARDLSYVSMLADLLADELEAEHRLARDRTSIDAILSNGPVETVFQPIIRLADGRRLGAEALSRFPGTVTPDTVFQRAHQAGRGIELEILAARQAVKYLPAIRAGQHLAVNLSPAAVNETAARMLADCGPDLGRLVLEVTETAVVHNYESLRACIAPLREQGLRLAIDDTGAGYSSLRHIIELGPDIIKIDRSLINGAADDASRRSAVRAFVGLAEDLNAVTVAEGIETVADLTTVRDLGVTAGQGYLLGPPAACPAGIPNLRKH
ncbi:EAL domain-containing protein [Paenarthrobacter sp. DKR-5]|uniref:EAL domain-containing protein n=1 Tax=Paenarthrobacter sp. DKR-5 TaxID=2835535 RepID=UPI001BDD99F5|nr:EAL domain-containing protein [Paenarthrobacter sp. DKR-5]MBT1003923.1 EAL domain-containing protein [Paenarthrobacter sp. DKR-5]